MDHRSLNHWTFSLGGIIFFIKVIFSLLLTIHLLHFLYNMLYVTKDNPIWMDVRSNVHINIQRHIKYYRKDAVCTIHNRLCS